MGYVHIYCGEGKGKTTAAVGLAVRMAGSGGRAVIARFLKSDQSGEVKGLRQVAGIYVLPCEKSFGFTWQMTEEQKRAAAEYNETQFKKAVEAGRNICGETGRPGLLVLDEVCAAVNSGLLEKRAVLDFLDSRPDALEVVLTGRDPAEEFLERADYISRIEKIRHPFDRGIPAREGVEY